VDGGNGRKPFAEIQHFIRVKRTDHKGYFSVLYPHRPDEPVPAFTAWAGGAGTTAVIGSETHTVVCAEQPGSFNDNGVACVGQRALVRQGNNRLLLALLAGRRIEAAGYSLEATGPAAVTVAGNQLSGEGSCSRTRPLRRGTDSGRQ